MGLKSQLMVAEEPSYGTYTAPTRAFEFLSESLNLDKITIESDGLRGAGRKPRRGSRRALVGKGASGNVQIEVGPDLFGLLFKHALGTVATTTPAGATNARDHTFTIGPLLGKSLTIQKGVEDDQGNVHPFSVVGCKITQLQLSVSRDGFLLADLTVDGRDVDVSEALGVAALPAGELFHFAQATLTKGGAALAKCSQFQVSVANPLKTDKRFLGNAGLKDEPTDDGYPEPSGQATLTFNDLTSFYNAFAADTAVALEIKFVAGEIETGYNHELTITLPDVRFTGDTPQVSGPQVPEVTVPFTGFEPVGGGEAITLVLRNGDATP